LRLPLHLTSLLPHLGRHLPLRRTALLGGFAVHLLLGMRLQVHASGGSANCCARGK